MIGPGGLLLAAPHVHVYGSSFSFIGGVAKKEAKLKIFILLSKVTYWARLEMLVGAQYNELWKNEIIKKDRLIVYLDVGFIILGVKMIFVVGLV